VNSVVVTADDDLIAETVCVAGDFAVGTVFPTQLSAEIQRIEMVVMGTDKYMVAINRRVKLDRATRLGSPE